jgi:hypothetical protein
MKTFSHLWQYLAEFFLEWEMFQIQFVEKSKYIFYVQLRFPENRAVYEIMTKNMAEPETPQMTRSNVACWISKVTRVEAHSRARAPTHTHRNMWYLFFSTTTIFSWTRLSVMLHVNCLSFSLRKSECLNYKPGGKCDNCCWLKDCQY